MLCPTTGCYRLDEHLHGDADYWDVLYADGVRVSAIDTIICCILEKLTLVALAISMAKARSQA